MKAFRFFAVALACAVMAVACKQPEPVIETSLKVSPETATFNANSPADASITVTANKAWTASSSASWLTLSATSGEGDARITLKATENVGPAGEAAEARTAEVTFASEDKTAVVKVSQKAETIVFVVDKTEAQVPADGASVVISVEYNTPYEVTIPAEATWITKGATKATTTASVTLSVAANDVTAAREATVTLTPSSGSAKTVKITQAAKKIEYKKLNNAENLLAFANAVNAGEDLAIFDEDGDGVYALEANIDLSGIDWPGIGTAAYSTAPDTTKAFRGVFNGANYTINNLSVNVPADAASLSAYGLFGATFGATIKDLNLGSGCVVNSKAAAQTCVGALIGFAMNTTVENCKIAATVNYDGGTSDNIRQSIGGFIGSMNISNAMNHAEKAILRDCTFEGKMTSKNAANTKNGGTGISLGGLVGFAEGTKNAAAEYPIYNTIENCVNNGTVSGEATRMGGIVASANNATHVIGCTNNGTISCTDVTATNSRAGGVVSTCNARTDIKDCVNNGVVEFAVSGNTTQGYAAGIVGQLNDASNVVDGCKNFGSVRSDIINGDIKYIGSIFANANKKAATVKNCQVEGYVGPYTDFEANKVRVNKNNFETYLSMAGSTYNGNVVFENNTCTIEGPIVISSLEALAAAAPGLKTLGATSTVVIDLDLDMAVLAAAGFDPQIDTLSCTLDFNGHKISNWNVTKPLILVNKGTLSNVTIDNSCSIAIPTKGDFGALVAVNEGTVSGCINNANASLDATVEALTRYGNLVGYSTGIVRNCKNTGSITIKTAKPLEAKSIYGGVLGSFDSKAGTKAVVKCENTGAVSYESTEANRDVCIGGVVGGTSAHATGKGAAAAARSAAAPDAGTIADCTNSGAVSIKWAIAASGSYTNIAGVIGYLEGCIEGCSNSGAISMESPADVAACSTRPSIGGVSACVLYSAKDCQNSGKISVRGAYSAGTDGNARAGGYYQPSFGGVFGQVGYGYLEATDLTVENCTNSGELDFVANQKTAGGTKAAVGGVLGYSSASLINCKNTGECTFSLTHNNSNCGGIVGIGYCKNLRDCINEGKILVDGRSEEVSANTTNKFSSQNYTGGIVGYVASYANFTSCENRASITHKGFINGTVFSYVGGMLGQYAGGALTMTECKNIKSTLQVESACAMCVGGLGGGFNGVMSGCTVESDIVASNVVATTETKESEVGGLAGYSNAIYNNNSVKGSIVVGPAGTFCGGLVGGMGNNESPRAFKGNSVDLMLMGSGATCGKLAGRFRYGVDDTHVQTTVYFSDNEFGAQISSLELCGLVNGHLFVAGELPAAE